MNARVSMLLSIFLLCASQTALCITFDLESPAVAGLDGAVSGDLLLSGITMETQAGAFDSSTNVFSLAGGDSTLSVIAPGAISGFGANGGLGINSTLASGTSAEIAQGVTRGEGIRFFFSSDVMLNNVMLPTFGIVGIRVLADDILVGDFSGGANEVLSLSISDALTSVTFAPITGPGLSSDPSFLVKVLDVTEVSAPPSVVLLITGGLLLTGLGLKYRCNQVAYKRV